MFISSIISNIWQVSLIHDGNSLSNLNKTFSTKIDKFSTEVLQPLFITLKGLFSLRALKLPYISPAVELEGVAQSMMEILRRAISDFSRKKRCKCFFRNESHENACETFEFNSKATWNPPKGALALELFISKTEKDIFSTLL